MSPRTWRNGKTTLFRKIDAERVVKHTSGQMLISGGVRKGGIIKGVWLPRVAITP